MAPNTVDVRAIPGPLMSLFHRSRVECALGEGVVLGALVGHGEEKLAREGEERKRGGATEVPEIQLFALVSSAGLVELEGTFWDPRCATSAEGHRFGGCLLFEELFRTKRGEPRKPTASCAHKLSIFGLELNFQD